jgi:hypothetical protein
VLYGNHRYFLSHPRKCDHEHPHLSPGVGTPIPFNQPALIITIVTRARCTGIGGHHTDALQPVALIDLKWPSQVSYFCMVLIAIMSPLIQRVWGEGLQKPDEGYVY